MAEKLIQTRNFGGFINLLELDSCIFIDRNKEHDTNKLFDSIRDTEDYKNLYFLSTQDKDKPVP